VSYPVLSGAVVITAANRRLRFREAAGAVGNVDLATGTYYLRGRYSTNLFTRSEEIDDAAWTKVAATTTANVIIAPDGITTVEKIITDNGATTGYAFQSNSTNVVKTFSCYAKAAEWGFVGLAWTNTSGLWAVAMFDLRKGTYVSTISYGAQSLVGQSIANVGNGWYRVSITTLDNSVEH